MLEMLNQKWVLAIFHIVIWVGYSLLVFTGPMGISEKIFQRSIVTFAINAFVFYFNTYFLLPQLMRKNRYLLYVLTTLLLLILATFVNHISNEIFLAYKFKPEMFNTMNDEMRNHNIPFPIDDIAMNNPPSRRVIFGSFHGPGFIMGFLSTLGILFLSTIFWIILESDKRNKKEMLLINENLKTEMKFLKSQINPHFLFNVLNNVYSLARIQSEKTPDMILKLSDMLRFVLYESEDKKVKLGREIDYIENYIEFQKIKIEGEPRIKIDFNNVNRELMIEPMLLIPFIENSFKHSKIDDLKNSWMRIYLATNETDIHFTIENSLPSSSINKDKIGGIGVENVKKRLNYLYPLKHSLTVKNQNNSFMVNLTIKTK